MKKFHIIVDGIQEGPFSFDDLVQKGLAPNALIWYEGLQGF